MVINQLYIGEYYYYNASLSKNQTTATSLITQVTFNPSANNVDCSNSTYTIESSYGIRPVITLKAGKPLTGGNGSTATPFTVE